VLFGVLVVLAVGVGISAAHFKAEQTPFVAALEALSSDTRPR
jgi:hypothetical protein